MTPSPRRLLVASLITSAIAACGSVDATATPDASVPDAQTSDAMAKPCTGCSCVSGSTYNCSSCAARPETITCVDGKWPRACGDPGDGCQPADVSTFAPPPYVPARRGAGSCTSSEITDFYARCVSPGSQCAAYKAAHAQCFTCLDPGAAASTRGPGVRVASVFQVNVGGCFELLGGASELSCAKAAQALDACGIAACAQTCPPFDDVSLQIYLACVQRTAADPCACGPFAVAVSACEQAIAASDAGAARCLGGQDQQTLFENVANVMCGGAIADAGGVD